MARTGGEDVSALRDRYFKTLELSGDDPSSRLKRKKALARAYALRTFEIEHYWKRATYFWGFQIAIFVAFGLLWKDPSQNQWGLITVALSVLGIMTAVANCLSAKGSSFWQQNWEHHIDMLEDEIEGRLYKTVWLQKGKAGFSVSKINQMLSYFLIFFWVIVALFVTYNAVFKDTPLLTDWVHGICSWKPLIITATIVSVVFMGVALLLRQTSDLEGTLPTVEGKRGNAIHRCSRWHKFISKTEPFIRRDAPDEPD